MEYRVVIIDDDVQDSILIDQVIKLITMKVHHILETMTLLV